MRLPFAYPGALTSAIALTLLNMARAAPKVLVYTATRGYRHDSIPTAIEVMGEAQGNWGVEFSFTEDRAQFSRDNLAQYDCIMFVSTSEDVLDESGLDAFQNYMQSGGNFVGVHSASACLQTSSFFNQTVGAIFDYHPDIQEATFIPLDKSHPATANLPDRWSFVEEVYYFRSDPRSNGAQVIMTVDEGSYTNTSQSTGDYPFEGEPHPIAWYMDPPQSSSPQVSGVSKAGRTFYTSLGHSNETWRNETFLQHVQYGLQWALDARSTRAFGTGLVGNSNSSSSSSASASGSSIPSTSSAGASVTPSASGTGTGTGAPATSSGAAGRSIGGGAKMGAAGMLLGLGAAAAIV